MEKCKPAIVIAAHNSQKAMQLKFYLSCLIMMAIVVLMPKRVIDRTRKRIVFWRKNLWLFRSKTR